MNDSDADGAPRGLESPIAAHVAGRLALGALFVVSAACSGSTNHHGGHHDADVSGPRPSSGYRPFSANSPWNTPIPANPALQADSAALIAHLEASSEWPGLSVSVHPWSVPVYYVGPDAPLVDVITTLSNEGENLTLRWPVPPGAASATESDGHMTLVDVASGRGYDFFQGRRRSDGRWECSLCTSVDLNGTGVSPPKGGPTPWYESHASRACGFPLMAGLITPEELAAGEIRHALVIAYPGLRQRWFVSPASTGHPANGQISQTEGIPCGGRVQLDPSIDLDTLAISDTLRTIARALQVYGAYVGDFSGSINVYADGSVAARALYGDTLPNGVSLGIDLSDLRVIAWGTLTPDG